MELLTGASLDAELRRRTPPLRVSAFAQIMLAVARALAAAHKSGVVHRDLKPTNIFLHRDRDGQSVPKVLDFGVSKVFEERGVSSLTMAGTVLGSPLYMSPEQAMGASNVDGRTDIFAFGAIMFEALCGYRPYDAPNFNALIVTIATTKPKDIDECAPRTPAALRALVRDCLVTERDARIASFEAVAERLEEMLPELEASSLRLPERSGAPSLADVASLDALDTGSQPSGRAPVVAGTPAASWTKTPDATKRPRGLVVAAAAFGVTLAVLGAVFVTIGRGAEDARTRASIADAPPPPPTAEPASKPAADEPPVVAVDSLPVAKRPGAKASPPGRLAITASPGSCVVAIDNQRQGWAPASAEVAPGAHTVTCAVEGGPTRTAVVEVPPGVTVRHKFDLGERASR
jgi:serine/threonine-protein kinase